MTSENHEQKLKEDSLVEDRTKSSFRVHSNLQDQKLNTFRKKLSISINYHGLSPYRTIKFKQNPIIKPNFTQSFCRVNLYRSISEANRNKEVVKSIQKPQVNCSALFAFFPNSQVLISINQHQKRQIASLTKIMTALTVIKICNTYGINIRETMITVQKQASLIEGTSANLRGGDRFLVIDLLYGLLLPSGNDAALALAQYFGKFLSFSYSTKQYQSSKHELRVDQFQQIKKFYDQNYAQLSIKLFVFQMNKNCHKLKLKNTKFSNPTGLTDKQNYSTAYDLAKLIQICLKNNLLRHIFKKKIYTCYAVNEKLGLKRFIEWRNTNKHLFSIRDCIGIKTGITPAAGPCLSAAYKVKGKQLIIVILNTNSLQDRYIQAQKVYNYAKNKVVYQKELKISQKTQIL